MSSSKSKTKKETPEAVKKGKWLSREEWETQREHWQKRAEKPPPADKKFAVEHADGKVATATHVGKHVVIKLDGNGVLQCAVKQAGILLKEKKELMTAQKDFDSKYVMIDAKAGTNPYLDKIQINAYAISELKMMAQKALGNKAMRIDLFDKYSYATSAGGVVAGVSAITPNTLSEFTSLAALFDEYRVMGGSFSFNVAGFFTNGTTAQDLFGVVVYDPVDATSITAVDIGLQKAQHQLFPVSVTSVSGGAGTFAMQRTKMGIFDWQVPQGIVISSSGSAAANPTSTWQSTTPAAGTYYPYGWIKSYIGVIEPVSKTGMTGYNKFRMEFRCRE